MWNADGNGTSESLAQRNSARRRTLMKLGSDAKAQWTGRTGFVQRGLWVCQRKRRQGRATACSLFILAATAVGALEVAGSSAASVCPLIDFEGSFCSIFTSELEVAPVLGYESFTDGNAGEAYVSCVTDLKEPQTHSRVARVEYNVSKLRSFAGFWLKWAVPEFSIEQWDAIAFDIRGCDTAVQNDCYGKRGKYEAFTSRVKVELKIEGWGWRVVYFDFVTTDWQTVRIPLRGFIETGWAMDPSNEFVVTFEEREATADRGLVYLDNVRFERRTDG
jgi:hypothetical protein